MAFLETLTDEVAFLVREILPFGRAVPLPSKSRYTSPIDNNGGLQ